MLATNSSAQGTELAAPQFGVGVAAFVYDCVDADLRRRVEVVCNPVIEVPQ